MIKLIKQEVGEKMRSKFILMLALLMGIITTVLFYKYMKELDQKAVIHENMVEVVVASQPIEKNQRVTAGMLTYTTLPEVNKHPQSISSIQEVEGKIVTSKIEKGEMLLKHRLKTAKEEEILISRKVREGYRAVSVGVNFVQTVSNLIEPEDYVDVIFSEVKKSGNQNIVQTQMILQKVRVLAVGRRMIESSTGEDYVEYSSATLELKPKDTVRLINASERGNIQLALHTRIKPPEEVAKDGGNNNKTG